METLKDIFVSKEIAKKLKGIGFSEPCIAYYLDDKTYNGLYATNIADDDGFALLKDTLVIDNHNYEDEDPFLISAPTYEQVFNWFRERYIDSSLFTENGYYYYRGSKGDRFLFSGTEETYKEAREQLILKLIEIYEQDNKVPSVGQQE